MFNTVTIVGIILFVALIAVVASRKIYFSIAYTILPILACFALGYNIPETIELFKSNISSTMGGLLLIIACAMVFFRSLTATGLFDVIAYHIARLTKGKSTLIYLGSFVVAWIGALSASVSSCYFLVFGAFSAVYKKLGLDLKKLLMLAGLSCAFTGAVPWSSVALQISNLVGSDPEAVFSRVPPLMIAIALCGFALCIWWGYSDKKNGSNTDSEALLKEFKHPKEATDKPMYRLDWRFWANLLIFLTGFVGIVFFRQITSWVIFLVLGFVTIAINYPADKDARKIFGDIGPTYFQLVAVFLPINLFLGVCTNAGIITNFVQIAVAVIPEALASRVHILLILVAIPIFQILPYQILFPILPFIAGICAPYGIAPEMIAAVCCLNLWLGTTASPLVATTYLGVSLAETDAVEFKKFAFLKFIVINVVVVVVGCIFGVFY